MANTSIRVETDGEKFTVMKPSHRDRRRAAEIHARELQAALAAGEPEAEAKKWADSERLCYLAPRLTRDRAGHLLFPTEYIFRERASSLVGSAVSLAVGMWLAAPTGDGLPGTIEVRNSTPTEPFIDDLTPGLPEGTPAVAVPAA